MNTFLKLWKEQKRECIMSVLAVITAFALTYLVVNHNWLSYLNRLESQTVTREVLATLSRNQFIATLYLAIYVMLTIVFVGHIWRRESDYKWLYLMAHVVLGILGCIGGMGLPNHGDTLLDLLANSYYTLAAVPLFLYLALLMERCKMFFVPLVLMYCICSSTYLLLNVYGHQPVAVAVAGNMSTGIFYLTLTALFLMAFVEFFAGNKKIKHLLRISEYVLIGFILLADFSWLMKEHQHAENAFHEFWLFVQNKNWEGLRTFYIQWILALICMIYVAVDYCIQWHKELITLQTMKIRLDSALEFADKSRQYTEEVRSIKHDMNRHLAVLHMYLSEGKQSSAIEYLEGLELELQEAAGKLHCKNILINYLIEKYSKKTEQKNILFVTDICLPEEIAIDEADLCSLIDNMLENAVEGCEKMPVGTADIRLKMCMDKNILRINCTNSRVGLSQTAGDRFATSKPEKRFHGFGIGIMEKICDKYGGGLSVKIENDRFCVKAAVPELE